jgi:FKBP-type peptidyl-prolyl cis-trans isomerase
MRIMVTVLAAALASAGCFEKLSGPTCIAAPWDVVSTSTDTITTTTGLRYIPRDSGSGNGTAWCRSVAVNYAGYLLDGTEFDSSIDRGRALIFTPGQGSLIDGFEQGVIGMRSCASRRLIIPPALGYGANPVMNDSGRVIVPPNSTVVFDIRMLEIGGEPVVTCDSTSP